MSNKFTVLKYLLFCICITGLWHYSFITNRHYVSPAKLVNNNHYNSNNQSCNNTPIFIWHNVNDFGTIFKQKMQQRGYTTNCSQHLLPKECFFHYKKVRCYCIQYSNPPLNEFCQGRIYYRASLALIPKHQLHMLNKHSLNKILSLYCNTFPHNNTICNFNLLTFDIENINDRIKFFTKYINCTINTPQHDKVWVFKENKHAGSGVHFFNNPQRIYKLISPDIAEENMYYSRCSKYRNSQKWINSKRYLKKEGFTIRKRAGKGFKVQNKGLVMQEFICSPLLIENKAFHVRSYFLVASYANPLIVLYYPSGQIFRNPEDYHNEELDKNVLRTNGHVAWESDGMNSTNFTLVWGFNRFQRYLNENYKSYEENVFNYTANKLVNDMKHIGNIIFKANEYSNNVNKLVKNVPVKSDNNTDLKFHIYCMDTVINDKFESKLLEMNVWCANYCMTEHLVSNEHLDNDGHEWMCQGFINEAIDILFEIYEKRYYKLPITNIDSLNKFQIAYWGNGRET